MPWARAHQSLFARPCSLWMAWGLKNAEAPETLLLAESLAWRGAAPLFLMSGPQRRRVSASASSRRLMTSLMSSSEISAVGSKRMVFAFTRVPAVMTRRAKSPFAVSYPSSWVLNSTASMRPTPRTSATTSGYFFASDSRPSLRSFPFLAQTAGMSWESM